MPPEFGSSARPTLGLDTETRLLLGLEEPSNAAALSQRQVKEITANRLRASLSTVVADNILKVNGWLDEVAAQSPAKALELLIELAQFSLPKLKAIAIDVRNEDGSSKSYSISDLERVVAEG